MISSRYGAGICRKFAEIYSEFPGKWFGIRHTDISNLLMGPGDRSTADGWIRDNLYDCAWIEVVENARYVDDYGVRYRISQSDSGDLVLVEDFHESEESS
jgi:hypothetical protein